MRAAVVLLPVRIEAVLSVDHGSRLADDRNIASAVCREHRSAVFRSFFVPEVLRDQLLIRAQRNVLRHVEHFVIVAVLASQQHRAAFEQDCGIGIKQQTGNAIRSFRENDRSSVFFAEIEDLLYCMRLRRARVRLYAAGSQIINQTHLDLSPKYSYVGLTAEKAGNEDLYTDTDKDHAAEYGGFPGKAGSEALPDF